MCKAFSVLITKSKKVYWKVGIDSHDQLQNKFSNQDKELIDDKEAPGNTFARVEIVPKNNNYIKPDKWVFKIDERVKPLWITEEHEKLAQKAHKEWRKELYSQIDITRFPVDPFKIEAPIIQKKHTRLVKNWANARASVWASVGASIRDSARASVGDSVGDSVWANVWDSVWDNVWASVGDSVRDSVEDSVWTSVGDSAWAQVGYMFPQILTWKYCEDIKVKVYPFISVVKLWNIGLMPIFHRGKWHLYGSPDGNGKIECLWTSVS